MPLRLSTAQPSWWATTANSSKEAIKAFDGTAIIVSHDRDFLDGLVTKVYEFGKQRVQEHLGGIYDYLEKKNLDSLQELEKKDRPSDGKRNSPEVSINNVPAEAKNFEEQKELKRRRNQLEKTVKYAEEKIAKLEQKIAEIEQKMIDPEGSYDHTLYVRHSELRSELESVTEQWMEASEQLENIK